MPARRILLALAASLLTTLSALPASAEQLYERLTLNAFGTLAATRVNVDGLAFSHPSAANRYERIRYLSSPDSVLGASLPSTRAPAPPCRRTSRPTTRIASDPGSPGPT